MISCKNIGKLNTELLFIRQKVTNVTIWFMLLSPSFRKEEISKIVGSIEHLKPVFLFCF